MKDFLKLWLADQGGVFPIDVDGHLSRDDSDVFVAIKAAAEDRGSAAHLPAKRIIDRDHFKVAYIRKADGKAGADDEDARGDTSADVRALARAAAEKFGEDLVAYGAPPSKKKPEDFAIREGSGRSSAWASGLSDVFRRMPESPDEYVLADADIREEVRRWLESDRERILDEARQAKIREAEEEV